MEKEFIPYELALRMKDLGFDEECFAVYFDKVHLHAVHSMKNDVSLSRYVTAPLFQQAFRWFDYTTDCSGFIVPSMKEGCFDWSIQNYTDYQLSIESDEFYRSREEAELACLEKLIEIVENNK